MLVQQLGSETEAAVYFPAFDGNGNVTTLVNSDNGAVEAKYDYSPFGKVLTMTGSYAETNPIRFSTKYTDPETDLAYFGYRYYNPDTGRWLNRDPIGEGTGEGSNLYRYCKADPVNLTDPYGLTPIPNIRGCGFYVYCGDIKDETWDEWLARKLGFKHCDLNSPNSPRDRTNSETYDTWVDRETPGRTLMDGKSAGRPCRCASCADIKECKDAVVYGTYHPWGNNCHTYTARQISRCCLKTKWKPSFHAGEWRCLRWEKQFGWDPELGISIPVKVCVEWSPEIN